MRTFRAIVVAVLCVALPGYAQDGGVSLPADAPIEVPPGHTETPNAVEVWEGDLFDVNGENLRVVGGCWFSTRTCIATARKQVAQTKTVDSCEKQLQKEDSTITPGQLAAVGALVAGALALGIAIGAKTRK